MIFVTYYDHNGKAVRTGRFGSTGALVAFLRDDVTFMDGKNWASLKITREN